ncbi:MAG TPA: hypothetical protein VL285_23780 [Bryobacteraceae bacterium]|jgi:hypothetical protein|nr:hypothetical protein [Bryobacteraceae bacterium]
MRPIVGGLFLSSCLLSVVSWYTTQQGMALYLSPWFALLASLGVQTALVLVAWLIGFSKTNRALLIAVYAITSLISISFSYVSLYTWFSGKERPAAIQRKLYDVLNDNAGKVQQMLSAGIAEGQKHTLALEEMTVAEKEHGYISRAQDSDPYLSAVREAVAREATSYSARSPEGSGAGLRYTAFDRYAKLARQSVDRMLESQRSLAALRAQLKPLDPTEKQLREYRQVYDAVPWKDVEQSAHQPGLARPPLPNYADFVDRTVSGQEDLMLAFEEVFTKPTPVHLLSLSLAAFIDLIVFLLAYASGPFFFGASEQRWFAAGAALEALDREIFVRDFLRKLTPGARGMARVDAAGLSPGEQQLCMLLVARSKAVAGEEDGQAFYILDPDVHERLLDSIAAYGFHLKAAASTPRPA